MDIAHSSLAALQSGSGQLSAGVTAIKSTLNSERQVAAILENAITAATPADGSRGTKLDITV